MSEQSKNKNTYVELPDLDNVFIFSNMLSNNKLMNQNFWFVFLRLSLPRMTFFESVMPLDPKIITTTANPRVNSRSPLGWQEGGSRFVYLLPGTPQCL